MCDNSQVKYCKKCCENLPLFDFNKCSKSKDGLKSWCSKCRCNDTRLRRISKGLKVRIERNSELSKNNLRKCTKCLEAKSFSNFTAKADGLLVSWCKECKATYENDKRRLNGIKPKPKRDQSVIDSGFFIVFIAN